MHLINWFISATTAWRPGRCSLQ